MMTENREELRRQVASWIRRDPLHYGYLADFFDRGAQVEALNKEGITLYNPNIDIAYVAGKGGDLQFLDGCNLILLEDPDTAKALEAVRPVFPCHQMVYTKKEPPVIHNPAVTTRMLTQDDVDFVVQNYHNPGAYASHISRRIHEGMVGGMVDGRLAGFAGVHEEGCIGMLEVIPEFRRRGVAEVLEAQVIAMQMERGKWPYVHVLVGNTASECLQKKLGLTVDEKLLYWAFSKN